MTKRQASFFREEHACREEKEFFICDPYDSRNEPFRKRNCGALPSGGRRPRSPNGGERELRGERSANLTCPSLQVHPVRARACSRRRTGTGGAGHGWGRGKLLASLARWHLRADAKREIGTKPDPPLPSGALSRARHGVHCALVEPWHAAGGVDLWESQAPPGVGGCA